MLVEDDRQFPIGEESRTASRQRGQIHRRVLGALQDLLSATLAAVPRELAAGVLDQRHRRVHFAM